VPNPLQERYAEILLSKISGDRHPSSTHMDMLESVAPMEQRVKYVLSLMERIEADPHPSIPLMQRVQRLVSEFGA
jgi:hypothetical protein